MCVLITDIFYRHKAVFPSGNKKTVLEIKNPDSLESTRIIKRTFSKYSSPLHKQKQEHRQKTDGISETSILV